MSNSNGKPKSRKPSKAYLKDIAEEQELLLTEYVAMEARGPSNEDARARIESIDYRLAEVAALKMQWPHLDATNLDRADRARKALLTYLDESDVLRHFIHLAVVFQHYLRIDQKSNGWYRLTFEDCIVEARRFFNTEAGEV
jgi:hypothetical protein